MPRADWTASVEDHQGWAGESRDQGAAESTEDQGDPK